MEIKTYIRRPFEVEVVRVDEHNYNDVADWCDGEIIVKENGSYTDFNYIKVPVKRALHVRQTYAHLGHYVVKAGTGFKVYTPKRFEQDFVESGDVEIGDIEEAVAELESLVKKLIAK